MHKLKSVSFRFIRTYVRKPRNGIISSKIKISNDGKVPVNIEELDHEDLDEFELDLNETAGYYNKHKSEVKYAKDLLQYKIVEKKCFKNEKEPNFLTFLEKEQIKQLYEADPEEWSIERLSNSFPALPDTIKKILKSRYNPESADKILQYDKNVINNWNKFCRGELSVDPILRAHLVKFKNRHIQLPEKSMLEQKFIPPKTELPKPKSKLFTSIVSSSIDQNKSQEYISGNYEDTATISHKNNLSEHKVVGENHNSILKISDTTASDYNKRNVCTTKEQDIIKTGKNKKKLLTFNEFVKDKLEIIYRESPEKAITLLHTYRKYVESQQSEDKHVNEYSNTSTVNLDESIIESSSTESCDKYVKPRHLKDKHVDKFSNTLETNINHNIVESSSAESFEKCAESQQLKDEHVNEYVNTSVANLDQSIRESTSTELEKSVHKNTLNHTDESFEEIITLKIEDSELDTYVKTWNKKNEEEDYPIRIKIPKDAYKPNVTYRVKDCYYDHDGVFLYRVPGMHS